jgi:hypothetical protein
VLLQQVRWSVLLLVAWLVALPPVFILDYLVMAPVRAPQVQVANLVEAYLEGGEDAVSAAGQNVTEAQRYGAQFTPNYTLHFSGFDTATKTLYAGYSDVVFDTGFALRCIVMGDRVTFCDNLSQKLDLRMGQMVQAGKTGECPWLENRMKTFNVTEDVIAWLQSHREQLSDTYSLMITAQKGNQMFVTAHFNTGAKIECRFQGNAVVTVDQCESVQ